MAAVIRRSYALFVLPDAGPITRVDLDLDAVDDAADGDVAHPELAKAREIARQIKARHPTLRPFEGDALGGIQAISRLLNPLMSTFLPNAVVHIPGALDDPQLAAVNAQLTQLQSQIGALRDQVQRSATALAGEEMAHNETKRQLARAQGPAPTPPPYGTWAAPAPGTRDEIDRLDAQLATTQDELRRTKDGLIATQTQRDTAQGMVKDLMSRLHDVTDERDALQSAYERARGLAEQAQSWLTKVNGGVPSGGGAAPAAGGRLPSSFGRK